MTNATDPVAAECGRQEWEELTPIQKLAKLFEGVEGLQVTFSRNCCSGIVSLLGPDVRCQCWRCRKDRGDEVTEETEREAERLSTEAQKAMRENVREFFSRRERAAIAEFAAGEGEC